MLSSLCALAQAISFVKMTFLPSESSCQSLSLSITDPTQIPLVLEVFLILLFLVSHILYLYWRLHDRMPCVRAMSMSVPSFWGNGPSLLFFFFPSGDWYSLLFIVDVCWIDFLVIKGGCQPNIYIAYIDLFLFLFHIHFFTYTVFSFII